MEKYRNRRPAAVPIVDPAARLLQARAVLASLVDWHREFEELGRPPRTRPPRSFDLADGVDALLEQLAQLPLDAATLAELAAREESQRDAADRQARLDADRKLRRRVAERIRRRRARESR